MITCPLKRINLRSPFPGVTSSVFWQTGRTGSGISLGHDFVPSVEIHKLMKVLAHILGRSEFRWCVKSFRKVSREHNLVRRQLLVGVAACISCENAQLNVEDICMEVISWCSYEQASFKASCFTSRGGEWRHALSFHIIWCRPYHPFVWSAIVSTFKHEALIGMLGAIFLLWFRCSILWPVRLPGRATRGWHWMCLSLELFWTRRKHFLDEVV